MSRRRLRLGPALLLTFAASVVGAPAEAQTAADANPAGAGPTVNAVWTEHEFTFTYFGRGTYYSCGGLENKIAYILAELGDGGVADQLFNGSEIGGVAAE